MIILPMPIYTPSTSSGDCSSYVSDYKSDISMCIMSILIDIAIAGLFFVVSYFTYYQIREQEYFVAVILGLADLLVLSLIPLTFVETLESFKLVKESINEHKENEAIKKRIAMNKRLNSLESYGEFEKLPEHQKRLYVSKENSIDNYVNSLFKKEKQNERK